MIIHDHRTTLHDPPYGPDHGKSNVYTDDPARIGNILDALRKEGFDEMLVSPREFDLRAVEEVHSPELVRFISSSIELDGDQAVYPYVFPYRNDICSSHTNLHEACYYCFDVGTVMVKNTFRSAKAAADAALEGAMRIIENQTDWAFALTRPPGHHADRDFYGGLCFFNNAAIATRRLSHYGTVALLDLDFHHGNGSQGIFYYDPVVLYVSLHGDPYLHFPFMTGHSDETGAGPGEGLNLNYPLPEDVTMERYHYFLDRAIEKIRDFGPDYIVVSMGFDTFYSDVLGDALFTTEDFHKLGEILRRTCLPLLVCLEGGYDLDTIGKNACNFVRGLRSS